MIIDNILASGSPRRRQLLQEAGVKFTVFSVSGSEELSPEELANPAKAAEILAERKAGAAIQAILGQAYLGQATVIAADTMVVLDGKIFGKPAGAESAMHMLRQLSGRTHQVITGVSVWRLLSMGPDKVTMGKRNFHEVSDVTFRELTDDEIRAYVATGESFDKAGAYGIQGEGGKLIDHYDGSYNNIVGLPVEKLLELFPDLVEN